MAKVIRRKLTKEGIYQGVPVVFSDPIRNFSNRYRKLSKKRKERYRKVAVQRKMSHEILANELLALGSDIRVETMRFQSLQKRTKKTTLNQKNGKINRKKRFGKSIANRAPAMLLRSLTENLVINNGPSKK